MGTHPIFESDFDCLTETFGKDDVAGDEENFDNPEIPEEKILSRKKRIYEVNEDYDFKADEHEKSKNEIPEDKLAELDVEERIRQEHMRIHEEHKRLHQRNHEQAVAQAVEANGGNAENTVTHTETVE